IMDKYDPKKEISLVVDEWGGWYEVEEGTNPGFLYQQNTMRDAMIAGTTLNIFNNRADRVKMANLAQTVNVLQAVILTDKEKMLLTPTYHVMHMYKVHQDNTLLPVNFDSPPYEYQGESLPAISISASRDGDGVVYFSLVNIDANKGHLVELQLGDLGVKALKGKILKSDRLQDFNSFEVPEKIKPIDFKTVQVNNGVALIELPPFSVLVLNSL